MESYVLQPVCLMRYDMQADRCAVCAELVICGVWYAGMGVCKQAGTGWSGHGTAPVQHV